MSEKSQSFVGRARPPTVAAKDALRKALMVVSFLSGRRHANTLPEVRAKVVHWTAAFVCTGAHSRSPVAVARAGPAEGGKFSSWVVVAYGIDATSCRAGSLLLTTLCLAPI